MGSSPDCRGYSRNYPGNKCALSRPPTQAEGEVGSFEVHVDEDHLKDWHWATCKAWRLATYDDIEKHTN